MGAADVEGVVRPHTVPGPYQLVGQGLRIGGAGFGVRHLEHGRDPAQGRRARAALQIFLPLQPRLAEMDLGVDHPRQHGQAGGVDGLAGRGLGQITDHHDPPVADTDIGAAVAGMVGDIAAANDQVIGLGHDLPIPRDQRAVLSASSFRAAFSTRSAGRSIMCWIAWFRLGSMARNSSTVRGPLTATPPHGP